MLNVGLGSDYVIHVLLRYRELAAEGQATNAALVETVRGVGSSLVLCAVTTAAGFYAFIPTTFSGVSELGLIAGTGVFFGLFVERDAAAGARRVVGPAAGPGARADVARPAHLRAAVARAEARARRRRPSCSSRRSRRCRA